MSTLPFGYALYQDLVDCRVFCSTVVYNDEILTGLRNLFSSDANGTNIHDLELGNQSLNICPEKFVSIDHFSKLTVLILAQTFLIINF